MVTIEKVDLSNKSQINRFINVHFNLYKGHPQWVPPLIVDVKMQMNKQKHPYYEHSDADFFIAVKDGRDVGRIGALENVHYNECHNKKQGNFYLFDTIDDQEVANSLFDAAFDWAKKRGLNHIVGPKGFGPLDGYGIQIEGFEHRQMMNMMNYNFPYYAKLAENYGFEKEVDFVSCYMEGRKFNLDERIHRIAERVIERGRFGVVRFKTKADLKRWAPKIGKAYNQTFVNNWEYVPLTDREISLVLENILILADPTLIKIITHDDDVIGFGFGFPDVSRAFQRAKGKLNPISLLGFLREVKKTDSISFNGTGVLPEFHGLGGSALMFTEMEKSLKSAQFTHGELTQIAETAVQMRRDIVNLGGVPYKNHRVFHKSI